MNKERFAEAIGMVDDKYYEEAANYQRGKKKPVWVKWGAIAACLLITLPMGAAAVAAAMGYDLVGWILAARGQKNDSPNPAMIQEQIGKGQWVYLNDDNLAVILPESPAKILLSSDGGETWRESVVEGSDKMLMFGGMREGVAPSGGFIGFFGENGYLVLTYPMAMGSQPMRIYLTGDGGETWSEIGNPYDAGEHYCALTGAGFSTEEIGFISYRYYEDAGPDIWWTSDGGETWRELAVTIPEKYANGDRILYVFTPGSPMFHGPDGVYPIEVRDQSDESDGAAEMIYMYSDDYGMTWQFR